MVDETKLNEFIGKILGDLGGVFSAPLVRMGDKLGLYKALKEQGPMTPAELAAKTNVAERYAREWLSHQAASGYLEYDSATGKFTLPPEQAMVFAEPDSPVYLQPAFDMAAVMLENQPLVEPAFRTGKGVGWGNQSQCLFCTTGRFFRPGYQTNLVASWLPALDGVVAKLERGATVADVGCGHGFSTIFMAKAFPKSTFVGYDFHPASVEQARVHAEQHSATANTKFEVALARDFPGKDLDLVTFFDCLHDMGDPVGAARHVRQTLKPDGSWMIVEPAAGDKLEDNLNPVSRMYYAASTMICVPTSLDQPVGAAFGAQAGFAKLSSASRKADSAKCARRRRPRSTWSWRRGPEDGVLESLTPGVGAVALSGACAGRARQLKRPDSPISTTAVTGQADWALTLKRGTERACFRPCAGTGSVPTIGWRRRIASDGTGICFQGHTAVGRVRRLEIRNFAGPRR